MQNESETEFHRVYKVSPTQQLTKLTHLLRESGDFLHTVAVDGALNCHPVSCENSHLCSRPGGCRVGGQQSWLLIGSQHEHFWSCTCIVPHFPSFVDLQLLYSFICK